MRLLGVCAGAAGGSAEIALKAALMEAEASGAEVAWLRLDDMRISTGPLFGQDGVRVEAGHAGHAGARHCIGYLGRPVRGGTGIPDGGSSSWRTGDDRLRPLRHLRGPLGRKRRIGRACKGRRFHSCPRLPAAHGNQPFETGAISMGSRAKHRYTHRCQPSGRYLAVSLLSSCRQPTQTWRTWSGHGRA